MSTAAIEISDLRVTYGTGQEALRGVTLTVPKGEVFGFLGPNGAGKTTTIKALLGFISPTAGTVRLCGLDPRTPDARARLGYLPEVARYYDYLRVDELLTFYGEICGLRRQELRSRVDAVLGLVGLSSAKGKLIRDFSKGMQQRAGLAQALLHDPDVLVFDEPMSGLDPLGRRRVRDIMVRLREEGKTVFFSSHELSEAEMICDRVGILKCGEVCWCGPTTEIAGDGKGNLERIFLELIGDEESSTWEATAA